MELTKIEETLRDLWEKLDLEDINFAVMSVGLNIFKKNGKLDFALSIVQNTEYDYKNLPKKHIKEGIGK